jgi:Flp pilus assembly protein TadG
VRRRQRGSGLTEFALAWPIVVLLVLAAVQIAVYGVESYSAREAALAGTRVGAERGATLDVAQQAALRALRPALVGAAENAWCPPVTGSGTPPRGVWVCASGGAGDVEVRVGGGVPAVIPLPLVAATLPISADAHLAREVFAP